MTKLENELFANVQGLCSHGVRFAGTHTDAAAARWLAKRLTECGLAVRTQQYQLMGWQNNAPARLALERAGEPKRELDCLALVYSAATPAEGVTGRLTYLGKRPLGNMKKFRVFERHHFLWHKYAVVDLAGNPLAHIISRDYPENAPVAAWGALELPNTLPTVLVNWETGRFLESLNLDQVKVNLKVSTEYNPTAVSFNIIGHSPGGGAVRSRDTILVTAHYDSQYNTVGAVDNATGVGVLLALAGRWHDWATRHRFQFVCLGAEEIGLRGAKYYAASLQESGEMMRVAAIVNLDMLGCNQPNWAHISDHQVVIDAVRNAYAALDIEGKYGSSELVCPPWPTGDQDPFYEEGIPTVSLTWKGSLYPYIHRPEDTIDQVDWKVTEDSFYLAEKILKELDHSL